MVFAFLLRGRRTQRWLRERPRASGVFLGVGHLLDERYLWSFRLLLGLMSLLMWSASAAGLYCFSHGADVRLAP
jgi:hypothetical protein